MPVFYKNDFAKLYEKKKEESYKFFDEKVAMVDDKPFKYLSFNIDEDIFDCAIRLATEKSKHTMKQNQAGVPRSRILKIKKCAQGVLGELALHILLTERYGLNVERFDLERESFEYTTAEYDLKIKCDVNEYEVESRSSNLKYNSIEGFIKKDVIIGPYHNSYKEIEDKLADFHFRPMYMPPFPFLEERNGKIIAKNLNKYKIIITGVATKDDFIKFSRRTTLSQKGTLYMVVDILKTGDIERMDLKFAAINK